MADNVGLLREVYEDWARGDYLRDDFYSPDIEFSLSEDFPDIGVEPGYAGLQESMRYWLSAWERPFIVEADEFIDAGNDQVIVLGRWRGISKNSGHVVERPAAHLWAFREGKAVGLMLCRDREEAFRFAGWSRR